MLQDRKLLSLGLMARTLGVSPKWLRSEAEERRLPHVKADRQLLFDPETVERILLDRAREAVPA